MSSPQLRFAHRSSGSRSSAENGNELSLSLERCPNSLRKSLDGVFETCNSTSSSKDSHLSVQNCHLMRPHLRRPSFQPSIYRVASDSFVEPLRLRKPILSPTKSLTQRALGHHYTTRSAPQLDGQSSEVWESEDSVSTSHSLITPPRTPAERHQSNRHERSDLTFPSFGVFLTPPQSIDDSTPLVQASPAVHAFPFPDLDRNDSPLSPLSTRLSSSPLRPSQRSSTRPSNSVSFPPVQTPDRFMPIRQSSSTRDSFEISRSPERLTEQERIVRSADVAPDPFSRRVRANAARLVSRLRASTITSTASRPTPQPTTSIVTIRRNSTGSAARTFSPRSIWNIGGIHAESSDPVNRIPDGRGGYITSGSTAPLYSANFFSHTDSASEQDMHERRLALALDIDSSSRLLSTSSPSSESRSLDVNHEVGSSTPGKLTWDNNEWNREGSTARALQIISSEPHAKFNSSTKRKEKEESCTHHPIQISVTLSLKTSSHFVIQF